MCRVYWIFHNDYIKKEFEKHTGVKIPKEAKVAMKCGEDIKFIKNLDDLNNIDIHSHIKAKLSYLLTKIL